MFHTETSNFITFFNGASIPLLGWKPSEGTKDAEKLEESVEAALHAGFRLIDTSYEEKTEVAVGSVLKKWIDEEKLRRDEIFIIAKLPAIGNSAEGVEFFLNKSLGNLQLQFVDLYLVGSPVGFHSTNINFDKHDDTNPEESNDDDKDKKEDEEICCFPFSPSLDENQEEKMIDLDRHTDLISIWKAMELLVDGQFAKSIGVTNFNSRQIKLVVKNARIQPAILQVEYHAYFQQKLLRPICEKYHIILSSFTPFGYSSADRNDFLENNQIHYDPADIRNLRRRPNVPLPATDAAVKGISIKNNKSPNQVLLRFLIQNNIVAIVKGDTLDLNREYMDVFEFELTEKEMQMIVNLDKGQHGRMFDLGTIISGLVTHNEDPFHEEF